MAICAIPHPCIPCLHPQPSAPFPPPPPVQVPSRLLMGPGPANAYPRILTAQALPLLGHMHPPFLKVRAAPQLDCSGCCRQPGLRSGRGQPFRAGKGKGSTGVQ